MMAWLEAGAGLMVAGLVAVRWLGSHMRLVWRYGPTHRAAVTATVVRPAPPRVVPGEVVQGGRKAIGSG